ncbi:hypothetical protein P4132_22520 [Pseudomonas aeruginosa]|nr:hypothetical protein [Pseudomonas aeruginosa]
MSSLYNIIAVLCAITLAVLELKKNNIHKNFKERRAKRLGEAWQAIRVFLILSSKNRRIQA